MWGFTCYFEYTIKFFLLKQSSCVTWHILSYFPCCRSLGLHHFNNRCTDCYTYLIKKHFFVRLTSKLYVKEIAISVPPIFKFWRTSSSISGFHPNHVAYDFPYTHDLTKNVFTDAFLACYRF